MSIISYLKQARRKANLSLQDMGYLMDVDFSNLSKYEKGKKMPPARVIIAYHIITKTPLKKLFKYNLLGIIDSVSIKTKTLIKQLEEQTKTPNLKKRIAALHEVLQNVGCLQDINENEYDQEQ